MSKINIGDIVKLAGIEFVVLDDVTPNDATGEERDLFIMTLKSQGESKFCDEGNAQCRKDANNYAKSDLSVAVNNWLYRLTEKLEERGYESTCVRNRTIDLTTLDGYKGYGSVGLCAAPLTLDEARKYAELIPNPDKDCWLATGWGGPKSVSPTYAISILPNGDWCCDPCDFAFGFRPALIVSSSPVNDITEEERLADYWRYMTGRSWKYMAGKS